LPAVKVLSVVGNRPQFVKSAPLSLALRDAGVDEVVLHTGQHYDRDLSAGLFDELDLPSRDTRSTSTRRIRTRWRRASATPSSASGPIDLVRACAYGCAYRRSKQSKRDRLGDRLVWPHGL
jgi:hypothetical protein